MDYAHEKTNEQLTALEKRLAREYRTAHRELEKKLRVYMEGFKNRDEAKREQLRQGRITRQQYNAWRVGQVAVGERWEAMRDSIAEEYVKLNRKAGETIKARLPETYIFNHNYAAYDLERGIGVRTSLQAFDRATVERMLKKNSKLLPDPAPDSATARRIAERKDRHWNKRKIQSAVVQGIIQGDKIENVARRLETITRSNAATAIRNARTAVTGAQNAGRDEAYAQAQDAGIDLMREWVATLDMRTRHSHALLHGERVKIGEKFSNGCRFPGDPEGRPEEVYNCRCTTIAQIKGFETDRVESSPEIAGMTFEEWQKARTKNERSQGNNQGQQRRSTRSGQGSAGHRA